jgi:protein phosphatase
MQNLNELIAEINSNVLKQNIKYHVINIIQKRNITIEEFEDINKIINQNYNDLFHNKVQHIQSKEKIYVIGDIHGSLDSVLMYFLISCGIKNNVFVFLGDYLDRGSNGLEVICLLMLLRLLYPKQIYMTIGNHELRSVYKMKGTYHEFTEKLNIDIKYDSFNLNDPVIGYMEKLDEMINALSFCIIINNSIFCCHGCPTENTDLYELDTLEIPKESQSDVCEFVTKNNNINPNLEDLLWSDPCTFSTPARSINNPRGCGKLVKMETIDNFIRKNHFELLLRAHQCTRTGIYIYSNYCVTLFGSPNYCGMNNDAGCCMINGEQQTYQYITFKFNEMKQYIPIGEKKKENTMLKRYFD